MLQKQGELKSGLAIQQGSNLPDIKPIRKSKAKGIKEPITKKIPVASDLAQSQKILKPVQADILEQEPVSHNSGFKKFKKGKVTWKNH